MNHKKHWKKRKTFNTSGGGDDILSMSPSTISNSTPSGLPHLIHQHQDEELHPTISSKILLRQELFSNFSLKEKQRLVKSCYTDNTDVDVDVNIDVEAVLPSILPENNNNTYPRALLMCIKGLGKKKCLQLEKLYCSRSSNLLNHAAKNLFNHLFDITSDEEKRYIELEGLEETSCMIFEFFKYSYYRNPIDGCCYFANPQPIPEDVIAIILEFCEKNLTFMNTVGLVNEKFYFRCLKSWRFFKINSENFYKIPVLTLRNLKVARLTIDRSLYVKDFAYMKRNLLYVQKLDVEGVEIEKLFSALNRSKPKIVLGNLKMVTINFSLPRFDLFLEGKKKKKKNVHILPQSTIVPQLKALVIPGFNINLDSHAPLFEKLTNLRIDPSFNGYFKQKGGKGIWDVLPDPIVIPIWWNKIEKLKALLIDVKLPIDGFKKLVELKQLVKLSVTVFDDNDVQNVNDYVYLGEGRLPQLQELKIKFLLYRKDERINLTKNPYKNAARIPKNLKLLFLTYYVENLEAAGDIYFGNLNFLNSCIVNLEGVFLEFIFNETYGKKKQQHVELNLAKAFQSLLAVSKVKEIEKYKIKCFDTRIINFKRRTEVKKKEKDVKDAHTHIQTNQ